MDKKPITVLDGSREEQLKAIKEFFGLSPEQSFQDLDVNVDDEED